MGCKHFLLSIMTTLLSALSVLPAGAEIISEARMMGLPGLFYDEYLRPLHGKKEIITPLYESFHRGSYREIGKSQADYLKKVMPHYLRDMKKMMDLLVPPDSPVRSIDPALIRKRTGTFFPEFLEEIEGFADAIGLDLDSALRLYTLYGTASFFRPGCTILAVGAHRSASGTVMVGRNFEWSPTLIDMSVTGVAPKGGYASLGCAYQTLGRIDGVNEHGLFIGMTGSIAKRPAPEGFLFPIIVRAVLDKARNVQEAVDLLKRIPHSDGFTYLVADRSGKAARVEPVPGGKVTVAFLSDAKDGVLAAVNHFQNPGARGKNLGVMPNSLERLRIISRLAREKEALSGDDICRLLTSERPGGVFWRGHGEIFGTLFSGIYDLEKGSWLLKAGDREKTYTTDAFLRGAYSEGTTTLRYENESLSALDFVSASPYGLIDIDGLYAATRVAFLSSPVTALAAEFNLAWKTGIFGTERSYGPHLEAGPCALLSPAFAKVGARLSFAPIRFLSLEITPFYLAGWKIFTVEGSSRDNAGIITERLNEGLNERHNTAGLHITPTLDLGGFLVMEHRFSRYGFNEPVYEYETSLVLDSGWVYSPRLTVILPWSPRFLYGAMAAGNYDLADRRYNAFAGPCLVFPRLPGNGTLFINLSYWIKLTEGRDRFLLLAGLMGRLY